jgi:hypothetical protein
MAKIASTRIDLETADGDDHSWLVIGLRIVAATIGTYALIYATGCVLAIVLPMARSESVYLIGMVQVLAFAPLVIWIFLSSSIWRVLAIMALVTAAGSVAMAWHGSVGG